MSYLKALLSKKDSVSVVMLMLFITKVIGFLKFRIIAGEFGLSRELDLFWAAFLVPDTIFNVLVAGSINAAIIPVFSQVVHTKGQARLIKLLAATVAIVSLISIIVTIITFIFTPQIASAFITNGFMGDVNIEGTLSEQDIELLTRLIRIMLLSPLFLGVSGLISAFLQVHRKFFITTFAPLLYNVGIIFGATFFAKGYDLGVEGLAWGVVLGSVLHGLIQLPLVFRFITQHLRVKSFGSIGGRVSYYAFELWQMAKLAIPRMIGYLGENFNAFINTLISFTLNSGALSAYKFAHTLHLFPVLIFGVAIGQVAMPDLAEYYAKGQYDDYKKAFNRALKRTLFIMLPVVITMVILRLPVVRLAYGVGEFDWRATTMTAWCLALLSVSILCQSVSGILLRGLYSMHETKLPMFVMLFTVVINILGSYYFTNFLSHYQDWRPVAYSVYTQFSSAVAEGNSTTVIDVLKLLKNDLIFWFTNRNGSDYAVGGLALSLSLTYLVEMTLNFFILNRKIKVVTWESTIKPTLLMVFNSLVMAVVMYFAFRLTDFSLDTSRVVNVISVFILAGGLGGVVYLLLSHLTGVKELSILYRYFRDLLKRFF